MQNCAPLVIRGNIHTKATIWLYPVDKQHNKRCWQRHVEIILSYNACGSLNWGILLGGYICTDNSNSNNNDDDSPRI